WDRWCPVWFPVAPRIASDSLLLRKNPLPGRTSYALYAFANRQGNGHCVVARPEVGRDAASGTPHPRDHHWQTIFHTPHPASSARSNAPNLRNSRLRRSVCVLWTAPAAKIKTEHSARGKPRELRC